MKKLLSAALTLLAASVATAALCAEETPKKKPKKPDVAVFTLADGSKIAGKVVEPHLVTGPEEGRRPNG